MRAAHQHTSADTQSTLPVFFSLLGVGCGKGQNKTMRFASIVYVAECNQTLEDRFPTKVNKLLRKCINAERKCTVDNKSWLYFATYS